MTVDTEGSPGSGTLAEPERRGSTEIADRVVERIAAQAVGEVDGAHGTARCPAAFRARSAFSAIISFGPDRRPVDDFGSDRATGVVCTSGRRVAGAVGILHVPRVRFLSGHDCLGTVAVQLLVRIGQPAGGQPQYLDFPRGELVQRGAGCGSCPIGFS
jgi:hypothetical protein